MKQYLPFPLSITNSRKCRNISFYGSLKISIKYGRYLPTTFHGVPKPNKEVLTPKMKV